jgi:hypothetical protein
VPSLPVTIDAGDAGHIAHHEGVHSALVDIEAPFVAAQYAEGALADRPAAGVSGRIYFAEDVTAWYLDDGSSWSQLFTADDPAIFTGPAEFQDDVAFTSGRPWTTVAPTGADATAEIQALNDDAPDGSLLWFEEGIHEATNLTIDNNVRWGGAGFQVTANAAFGHSAYANDANLIGTVLKLTATSGYALNVDASSSRRVWLEHMAIVGPGSGTSVGVRLGGLSSMHGGVLDVGIYNFSKAVEVQNLIGAEVSSLVVRGCTTGVHAPVGAVCNANTWTNTEIQFTTADGILIEGGNVNMFVGGTLQNISGTAAVRVVTGDSAAFMGFYCEAITATNSFNLGGSSNSLSFTRWAANASGVTVSGNNAFLYCLRGSGTTALTLTGNDIRAFCLTSFAAPTDSGLRNTYEVSGSTGGKVTHHGAVIQRTIAFANGDTTPSVAGGNIFTTANTSATSISDFDDGVDGQEITVKVDANTTILEGTGTLIRLAGGVNFTGSSNDLITFVSIAGVWFEKCRSLN